MMVTTAIHSDRYSPLLETQPSQTSTPPSTAPALSTPLKHISARDLKALHRAYVEAPLPSGTLFPWLHGVDGHDPHQNAFFEIDPMAGGVPVPCHRGLILVHASDLDHGRLVGSVSASELLEPIPTMPSPSEDYNNNIHRSQDKAPARPSTPSSGDYAVSTTGAETASSSDAANVDIAAAGMENALTQTTTSNGEITMTSTDSSADSSLFLTDDSLSFDSTSSANAQALIASLTPIADSDRSTLPLQPRFLSTETDGINIRNFKIQVARYATISNIVVYGSAPKQQATTSSPSHPDCVDASSGGHEQQGRREWLERVIAVANLISDAQEDFFLRMQPLGMQQRCETMVVTESFQSLEQQCPELIAVDSAGRPTQHNVDFWEQEREKMALLTRVSEIAPGVWLGNHTDVPTTRSDARSLATPVSPGPEHSSYFSSITSFSGPPSAISISEAGLHSINEPSTPPNDYPPLIPPISTITSTAPQPSVCIECRAGATAPPSATLDHIRSSIPYASAPLPTKDIFHVVCSGSLTNCVEPHLFPPSTSSLSINTGFSTGVDGTPRNLLPCQEEIAAMHATQRTVAAQIAQGSESGHAILRMQIAQLVEMALFVEQVANELPSPTHQPSQRRHEVLLHCVDGYTDTSLLALSYIMLHYQLSLAEAYVKLQLDLGRSFFVYPNDALMMLQVEERIWDTIMKRRENEMQESNTTTTYNAENDEGNSTPIESDNEDARPSDIWTVRPFHRQEHDLKYGWFYHQEFEGSFPSRILPFLYLGNLAHASNPGLLETLGIGHVLSVGEATGLGYPDDGTGLFVKLVDDMFDNGIHSLWGHLEQCVGFIETARRSQSRVLIHCRVGVSRSATIVIAYLMAYYKLSLVDAYLTVRARRLNVIIQPNLLFMYELLQWDQRLRGRFDALGWIGIAREIHALNMYYIGGQ
ncbi:tyrosine/serine/threonine protein phosphatase pps1 [Actinomortierella ambigua]|uniref:Tyrosine/serine/threonine protein phosphatase pps1 n=1 Tax=Actinomortierella ambigua TaxID=1343610 RepID=A0A9P6QKI3_9FUNG|nr:tyrosine/serine/threonine protein phosphatase pps1 [Actinomortierella ambigua]